MATFKNLFSIFKWKEKKQEVTEHSNRPIKPTPFDIKSWAIKELPPLAWERITLRTSRYLLQNYQKTLNQFPPNEVLPVEVVEKVRLTISELYQKEINFENQTLISKKV
ncbi:MAG: hypothetical protein NZ519_07995 [Bacteroidia bacterium]|nr:hypothetical protein [Bacteroidia bacterium]MDW8301506.1 hypothetical protein [Bacteroidia bacterium]